MKVSIKQAKVYIRKTLSIHGYNSAEVSKISEVILYAALRGSSQGFPKLFGWHIEKDERAGAPIFKKVTPAIGRYNAKRNNSMYVCNLATDKLLEMVVGNGLGLIGIYNNNNSSGAIGFYTKKLASKGFIGIMFSSADPIGGIAPPNSKAGVFGSNPLAISVPYKNSDITLDMSTAKFTWGDLVQALNTGSSLDVGFAHDSEGKSTTDPKKAMDGTVAAFDGTYKGLGLAMMIQIIAGALVGSVYEQSDETCDYGSLMLALDPRKLSGQKFLEEQISKVITIYKKEGGKNIYLPGEKGDSVAESNLTDGTIEIPEELLKKIQEFVSKK